ncbi:hypothetical protein [Sphingomonas alba]|uniref:Uncharacterized protein n=1 Tax=Sphingomonas alba TaxID=2908208 RepID=A0ABT0RN43_9SPHN|nr:hypothetical protein [Sphingomonas alba]MCL6684066.1 hypothetical protein [Sphingomonas alba]
MRRLFIIVGISALAACAPKVQTPAVVTRPIAPVGTTMIGFTENDLVSRFGQPTFQVKEGPGTKLQWAHNGCVLDAYLYPESGHIGDRVAHVDTRAPSGADISINTCLDLLQR